VRIENPVAFSFILQDDLYLLNDDRSALPAVETPAAAMQPVVETPALSFNYLGQHKKQYLILVYYPGLEFMPAPYLTALENTLKRLGFGLEDVAIVNTANYKDIVFKQLENYFKPQKLLVLGRQALPAGFEAPTQHQQAQVNNRKTLFTFSFDEMMENNEHKKIFWEQMKLW